jgi:hypothetical protein
MAGPDDRFADSPDDRGPPDRDRRRDDDDDYEPRRFRKQDVPNYLVPGILVTLFCCTIGGIVTIIYAAQANTKAAKGDYEGALQAANTAKTWMWVSIAIGAIAQPLLIYVQIAGQKGGGGF